MSPTKAAKRARLSGADRKPQRDAFPFEKRGLLSSTAQGKYAFKWLLSGISVKEFFTEYFEKKPTILRNDPSKFQQLISVDQIRELVVSRKLAYGKDLDVTKYTVANGRSTLNGDAGSVAGRGAWDQVTKSNCSMRLLRPQEHIDALWHLCALLEGFLGCVVGANAYLTPTSSQGFAPHFDDIDAFVCQVSGRKRWRVYAPRGDGHDVLPRASSVDFTADEMKNVKVLYDEVLFPGDMLYLPRGTIHQAECLQSRDGASVENGSLHVTISAFQTWTWADLLLASFDVAIRSAAAEDKALRRTLPHRFGDFVGVSKGDSSKELRAWFEKTMRQMVRRVGKHYPTDSAGDLLVERFMSERLPPAPPLERRRKRKREAGPNSAVRAVGGGIARVVMDTKSGGDGLPRLIHCVGNSRAAGEVSDEAVSCTPEEAFAVDLLLSKYPECVVVRDLPFDDDGDCVELARGLVDMGIVEVVE